MIKFNPCQGFAVTGLLDPGLAVVDVDPAFLDWRMNSDDPSAGVVAASLSKVTCPVLVVAGEPRLGASFDDAAEFAVKRQVKDFAVRRFPGQGHIVHGFRPEPFLEALEPFLRRMRATKLRTLL